jgi:hypothetical protein
MYNPKTSHELSFKGPFADDQQLLKSPIEKPWIIIEKIEIAEKIGNVLNVNFKFNGKEDTRRKIHVNVVGKDINGKTFTLRDEDVSDMRPLNDVYAKGTTLGLCNIGEMKNSIVLPIKPYEIRMLNVIFHE